VGDPNSFEAKCYAFGQSPTKPQLEWAKSVLGGIDTPTGPTEKMYDSLPVYPTNSWGTLWDMLIALIH
jgi:hypothetical protein